MAVCDSLELLEECIDNKGNYNIVDDHHTQQMKKEKEKSHPLATCNVFKADFAFRPVVDNQKVEQHIHPTYHVIKIVGPIGVIHKVISLQEDVG